MNYNYKYIGVGLVVFFALIGLMLIGLQPKPTPEPPIIEVEKYIIKESEKKFDSLKIELQKIDSKIKELENKKHEKIKNHKPIERVIVTDSARQINVNRFFR
jgi:hypothetical protein